MDFDAYNIYLVAIQNFFIDNSISTIFVYFFVWFGWLIFAQFAVFLILYYLAEYKEGLVTKDWQWVVLAVDVPAMNLQTPRAVEQLFAHLSGAFIPPRISDKFRRGYKQRWFSFEIVSIEGYIQFIIRTENSLRDLVEAAIYAQYPAAEITEVEDYALPMVKELEDGKIDVWISDFTLTETEAYPIRTYESFEHNISKDEILKDPMAPFLESFSRIGRGEQMWFQILIEPRSNSWKEGVIKEIKKLIGEKVESKSANQFAFIFDNFITREFSSGFKEINAQFSGLPTGESAPPARDKIGPKNELQFLTPGQKNLLEGMEGKIAKMGFKTKMRGVYLAKKEFFRPERGVYALIGAVNQYNSPTSNSLAPSATTGSNQYKKGKSKGYDKYRMLQAYAKRKINVGAKAFMFNIEELATVWHFPMSHVKTPLLEKSAAKRAEPPTGLPVDALPLEDEATPITKEKDSSYGVYETDSGYVGYDKSGIKFG